MEERSTLTREAVRSNRTTPAICVHLWRSVGRVDVHAQIGLQKKVRFVRCTKCGQDGFRRICWDDWAQLKDGPVFTWTKDESQWLTS